MLAPQVEVGLLSERCSPSQVGAWVNGLESSRVVTPLGDGERDPSHCKYACIELSTKKSSSG